MLEMILYLGSTTAFFIGIVNLSQIRVRQRVEFGS